MAQTHDIFAPLPDIEAALAGALARASATPRLREAMAYATLGAGKRIRPLLSWHCCAAMGGVGEDALPACVAVELVHCFSLVHDDLPALDNDVLRRGKPTLHVKFGEAMAVLAGDAMLNMAAQVLAGSWGTSSTPEDYQHANLRLHLLRLLTAGTEAMVAGQVADTMHDFEASLTDPARRLAYIHTNKTGALLTAACVMGASCSAIKVGGVDPDRVRMIERYSEVLGVLFQAVDDLLDVTQSAEHTGKRTQKDAEAGKLTYPTLYGTERTRELIAQYRQEACESVKALGHRADPLRAIADLVATRTK